jgi:flagellar hook protein FlgE
MYTSVSGMNAQGQALANTADNIANARTVGFKRIETPFETLVTSENLWGRHSPGGVIAKRKVKTEEQGMLEQTSSPTDLAVSGDGFFVVNKNTTKGSNTRSSNKNDEYAYTRAGAFERTIDGFLKNTGGFHLYGWKINSQDRNYGADNLEAINLKDVVVSPKVTSNINLQGNISATMRPGDQPFVHSIKVHDSLGLPHSLNYSFARVPSTPGGLTAGNTLEYNVTITCDNGTVTRPGSALANANQSYSTMPMRIVFDQTTGNPSTFDGQANPEQLHVDFGTTAPSGPIDINQVIGGAGQNDGLTSVNSGSQFRKTDQDGESYGIADKFQISSEGILYASCDNGRHIDLYKIPLATFKSPVNLEDVTGNVFLETAESGEPSISDPLTYGKGAIKSAMIENSKTDLGTEFTNLIFAQKVFAGNATVMRISGEMTDILQGIMS